MCHVLRSVAIALLFAAVADAQQSQSEVRQIISEKCLGCHGPAKMSGLSLTTREGMLAGGKRGPAIVPGKSAESLLYKAVAHLGELSMPPAGDPLTHDQVNIIGAWIDAGAPYTKDASSPQPEWWSFRRPVHPNANLVDDLVKPNRPAASRTNLIRRAPELGFLDRLRSRQRV